VAAASGQPATPGGGVAAEQIPGHVQEGDLGRRRREKPTEQFALFDPDPEADPEPPRHRCWTCQRIAACEEYCGAVLPDDWPCFCSRSCQMDWIDQRTREVRDLLTARRRRAG
jgi:hypothetical protein